MKTLTLLIAIVSLSLANLGKAGEPAFNDWTKESLGATDFITGSHGKIKTVIFAQNPHGKFHGPQCLDIILGFLRGPNDHSSADDMDSGDEPGDKAGIWTGRILKDRTTGCTITMDHIYDSVGGKLPPATWHFIATKNGTTVLTAEMRESYKLGPKLILHVKPY